MDKLDRYRDLIESKLNEFVRLSERAIGRGNTRDKAIFDRHSDNYLVVREGWDESHRILSFVINIEIINSKIVIQEDWTEHGLARALEEAGVPKSDIVLGFQPPDVRPLTGYAIAA
ncbi:MAG: XisI protein [Blastocatellia bacterium]